MEYIRKKGNIASVPTADSLLEILKNDQREKVAVEQARLQSEIDVLQEKTSKLQLELEKRKSADYGPPHLDLLQERFKEEKKKSILASLGQLGLQDGEEVIICYARERDRDFGGGSRSEIQLKVLNGLGTYVIDTVTKREDIDTWGRRTASEFNGRTAINEAMDAAVVFDERGRVSQMPYALYYQHIESIVGRVLRAQFAEHATELIAKNPLSTIEASRHDEVSRLELEVSPGERIGVAAVRYSLEGQNFAPPVQRVKVYSKTVDEKLRSYDLNVSELEDAWGDFDFANDTLSRLTMLTKDKV